MTDDYAGSTLTLGTASLYGWSNGAIESAGDTDWFRITLEKGHVYTFSLVGSYSYSSGLLSLSDPYLEVHSSSGSLLLSDDDGGTGLDALIQATVNVTGTYYLAAMSSTFAGVGGYQLSVRDVTPPDDYDSSTLTLGRINFSGQASGVIEVNGDTDWFKGNLVSGHTYSIALEGADSGKGSLADPFLSLRNAYGTQVAADDDGGVGNDALVVYTAGLDAAFYVSVESSISGGTGSYQIKVTDITPVNNAPTAINGILSTQEDKSLKLKSGDFGFSDIDGDTLLSVIIIAPPASGTLKLNGVTVGAYTVVSAASIAAGLLTFTPPANVNGQAVASLTFRVQDDGGVINGSDTSATYSMTFNVTGVNDAPVLSVSSVVSVGENQLAAFKANATDIDSSALTYSLSGADATLFKVSSSGVVSFKAAPDFEAPGDVGANNVYNLSVRVSDGTLTDSRAVAVSVTNQKGNVVDGTSSADIIDGSHGVLGKTATPENDTLRGNAGNDTINGGGGPDIIVGGTGKDQLKGGEGFDTFKFLKGDSGIKAASVDKITDWSTSDAIDTAIKGTTSNYYEHSVSSSVDTIEEAAAYAEAHATSAVVAHVFLYNSVSDIGFLLMDLDNNDTLETGLVLPGRGSASDFSYVDLI